MRLRWTTPATDDLYNIVQHIQQDNPDAASDVAQTIYDGCSSLENFPHLGRKGRIAGTRETRLLRPTLHRCVSRC
jgi:toxin ParE1/3/4